MKKIVTVIYIVFSTSMGLQAQSLSEYEQMAVSDNPGVQAAYKAFEASLEQITQVNSLPDPIVTASVLGSRIETRTGRQEARFSLMQMFPWFGTLAAKKEVASLGSEAKFEAYLNVRNQLLYKVRKVYSSLYELHMKTSILEENLELLKQYRKLALSKFKNSRGHMSDVLRLDIKIDDARTDIEILKLEIRPVQTHFNALLNRPFDTEVFIQDELPLLETRDDDLSKLKAHPRVKLLDHTISMYRAKQHVIDRQGYPNIGLGLDYSVIRKRVDANPQGNGKDAIMPVISMNIPLFRKNYRAAKREAQLMEEMTDLERQEAVNSLEITREQAHYTLEKEQQRIQLFGKQIKNTKEALKLMLNAYSNGTTSFEEILSLQQDLLIYQLDYIKALKEQFSAKAQLAYITFNMEDYEDK